jgi:hypothetical protein
MSSRKSGQHPALSTARAIFVGQTRYPHEYFQRRASLPQFMRRQGLVVEHSCASIELAAGLRKPSFKDYTPAKILKRQIQLKIEGFRWYPTDLLPCLLPTSCDTLHILDGTPNWEQAAKSAEPRRNCVSLDEVASAGCYFGRVCH